MHTRTITRLIVGSCQGGRLLRTGAAIAILALCSAAPVGADELEWIFDPTDAVVATDPPLPGYPIHLILDDDTPDGTFGVGAQTAQQFLWFNRFSSPGSFLLEEIWVLFPSGANMAVGGEVQLAVYLDPDYDPSNGADLLATVTESVQVVDGTTFSVYTLSSPIPVFGHGDILVGVVDRFVESGVTSPTTPASIDTTASQGRSWLAVWNDDPPDPPLLPPDGIYSLIDAFQPGNWMIRAFGTPEQAPAIPTVDRRGVTVMLLLISIAGVLAARRLR